MERPISATGARCALDVRLTTLVLRLQRSKGALYQSVVEPLIAGVKRVRIARLEPGWKVQRHGDALWLDSDYVARTYRPRQEQTAACALYFFHEMLHLPQGLGDKATVRQLRAAEGEDTLLRCDLAADHAAATLLCQVERRWRLSWLKEVQLRSLAAFPVNETHSPSARRRKCRRLASLGLEVAARRAGLVSAQDTTTGALWVDFAREGGPLLLLRSAPLEAVVLSTEVTFAESHILDHAADPQSGVQHQTMRALCEHIVARHWRMR